MQPEGIEKVKEQMYLNDILQKEAVFQCYSDHIFTYEVNDNGTQHEICVIPKDKCNTFFNRQKVVDFFDQSIEYIHYKTYGVLAGKTDIDFSINREQK